MVATAIKEMLKCDWEEIIDLKNRQGWLGYLLAGRDATLKRLTRIAKPEKDPAQYDLVVIGTPVWSFNVSSPIRTYLVQYKNSFKNVAFFCTQGGSGSERTFREMSRLCQKEPIATLELKTKKVFEGNYLQKVQFFAARLMNG